MKIVLTEQEWDALCDRTFDEKKDEYKCVALPVCCANISAFRDQIIILREHQGELSDDNKRDLLETFEWVKGSHGSYEWDWATINKLMDQIL